MPLYALHLGHMREVIELIDRFGDEVEYDLHAELSLDLLDFFRGHYTWDKLIRLVTQLPWWSRYKLAQADDDEIGQAVLDAKDDDTDAADSSAKRPPLTSWDPFQDVRADMRDGFNSLIAQQSGDKKKRRTKPTPRPETGEDRARKARDHATVTELYDTFAPGR